MSTDELKFPKQLEEKADIQAKLIKVNESLKEAEKAADKLRLEKEKLYSELDDLQRQVQEDYYTIVCTPSDSHHCQYTTGVFSSAQIARKYLPKNDYYDCDDNCTWRHAIQVVEGKKVYSFADLDKPPRLHS